MDGCDVSGTTPIADDNPGCSLRRSERQQVDRISEFEPASQVVIRVSDQVGLAVR